jgi:hypothetical protein
MWSQGSCMGERGTEGRTEWGSYHKGNWKGRGSF